MSMPTQLFPPDHRSFHCCDVTWTPEQLCLCVVSEMQMTCENGSVETLTCPLCSQSNVSTLVSSLSVKVGDVLVLVLSIGINEGTFDLQTQLY